MRLSTITELPPAFVAFLEEQEVKTDSDFLSVTSVDIIRKLPQGTSTLGRISYYKTAVARASSAPGFSGRTLLQSTPSISPKGSTKRWPSLTPVSPTLSPYTGRVIEVSGDSDSRKSEFILNVALANLSSDAKMTVYWVDTMGDWLADHASDIADQISGNGVPACLDRLRWSLVLEVEQIYDILEEIAASAKSNEDTPAGIGYLVIDKITSLLGPLLTSSSCQGHVWMAELMRHLRAIAKAYSITVLVLNDNTSRSLSHDTGVLPKIPALGSAFTFLTDATIWISPDPQQRSPPDPHLLPDDSMSYRVEVLKANFMGSSTFGSFVLKSGLHLLPET